MFASMSLVSKSCWEYEILLEYVKHVGEKRDPACTHKDMQYMYIELYKINKYIYIYTNI